MQSRLCEAQQLLEQQDRLADGPLQQPALPVGCNRCASNTTGLGFAELRGPLPSASQESWLQTNATALLQENATALAEEQFNSPARGPTRRRCLHWAQQPLLKKSSTALPQGQCNSHCCRAVQQLCHKVNAMALLWVDATLRAE